MIKTIAAAGDPAREIFSQRLIDAPRERIFRAYADPQLLARWWGPEGFRNSFEEFDFRPGGHWRFVMHGPDGTDYANHNMFLEIEAPARIVIQHQCAPHFSAHISLDEAQGDKTLLSFRMHFESAAVRDQVAAYAIPANEQNFDRLQAVLATMAP
ncbi:MAG: SRPBCC family protein [Burkholderiaceae bacterium]